MPFIFVGNVKKSRGARSGEFDGRGNKASLLDQYLSIIGPSYYNIDILKTPERVKSSRVKSGEYGSCSNNASLLNKYLRINSRKYSNDVILKMPSSFENGKTRRS